MNEGYQLSAKAIKQIADAVRKINSTMQNPATPPRGRWQKGGGGSMVWAKNRTSLAPATTSSVGVQGTADLYEITESGLLSLSGESQTFRRRDTTGTVAANALIIIAMVSGEWTLLWNDRICPATPAPVIP